MASAYYLGSAESPTADFLLVWLKSSRSDPCRYAASQTCRPQVGVQLRPLCFYGWRLSHTVPAGCTGSICQNSRGCPKSWRPRKFLWKLKILSRLLSVLSLRRKFVHDHCCCPNSATILTDSKMKAILDFWRSCQNLSIIQRGG